MFIKLTERDGDRDMYIRTQEISMVVAIKEMEPKIFIGAFVGLKNGQSAVVKNKVEEIMPVLERAS